MQDTLLQGKNTSGTPIAGPSSILPPSPSNTNLAHHSLGDFDLFAGAEQGPLPHTSRSVAERWAMPTQFTAHGTTMTIGVSSHLDSAILTMTLTGPEGPAAPSRLLGVLPGRPAEERTVVATFSVGSDKWPSWDAVNVALTAISSLVMSADGYVSDGVVAALREHLDVVSTSPEERR